MIERDLKVIALQMAALLPDDRASSLRVHMLLGEIIVLWLYKNEGQAFLRDVSECSESNITRLPGRDAKSAR